jgi:ABC-type Fe3+ transport system permease subunit
MAGRRVGYFQAAVMVAGFVLTMFYMLAVIVSQIRYATQNGLSEDQAHALYQQHAWAGKTGVILCLYAWCWSLVSTIIFLASSEREPPFLPPKSRV